MSYMVKPGPMPPGEHKKVESKKLHKLGRFPKLRAAGAAGKAFSLGMPSIDGKETFFEDVFNVVSHLYRCGLCHVCHGHECLFLWSASVNMTKLTVKFMATIQIPPMHRN